MWGLDTVRNAFQTAAIEHNIGYQESSLVPFILGSPTSENVSLQKKEKTRLARSRSKHEPRRKKLKFKDPGYEPGAY